MPRKSAIILAITLLLAFGVPAVYAGGNSKVEVCHRPPGNPDNFHTITINENTFAAHLAHGDLPGACNALCAELCDDGNSCTIDDTGDCEDLGCPTAPEVSDCDDGEPCTADSCDAAGGCVNTPRLGEACDDGQLCSGPDICNSEGVCQGMAIDDCCVGDEDCSQNLCDQASCNLDTNRCGQSPVVCIPPDLCTVSECANDTGACVEVAIQCAEGETCDPSSGECAPAVSACPCLPGGVEACVAPGGAVLTSGSVLGLQDPFGGLLVEGQFVCEGDACLGGRTPGYSEIGTNGATCSATCVDGTSYFGAVTTEEDAACTSQLVDYCLANDPACTVEFPE